MTELVRLGTCPVKFHLQLKGIALSRIVRFAPRQRDALLRATLKRQFASLDRRFPDAALRSRDAKKGSWTLDGSLPANRISALASRREVASVSVDEVQGRSKRRQRPQLGWWCVWGVVAVQVEGQRSGSVSIEDRFVLVRAYDEEDARRRLQPEWARYANPYLNPSGYLVRWQLLSVKDVYALYDDKLSPAGTEVYSRLRTVRMKPEYRWLPDASRDRRSRRTSD